MSAFRKRKNLVSYSPTSANSGEMIVPSPKTVCEEGGVPYTVVEMRKCKVSDFVDKLGDIHDEDYQLADMIRSGNIPEEVPVHGMLSSDDPTDLSNQGVGDDIFNRLTAEVDKRAVKPVSEPVEPVKPAEPTVTNPTE